MSNTANTILAPQILAHLTVDRALRVGDLAVFVDYKGRKIGGSVTRIDGGAVWVKVIGDQNPYNHGCVICRDAVYVTRAI